MEILSKKQKAIAIGVIVLIVLFIIYYFIEKTQNNNYEEIEILEGNEDTEIVDNEQDEELEEKIIVHITGAVISEGIVEVEKDSRIADVIEEAGGVSANANLLNVNLAYKVSDGQKIYIPNINENIEKYIVEDAGNNIIIEDIQEEKNSKININNALQTELETLSGIGPSIALKIIQYREENGEFKEIEELKDVTGIGDAKFDSIKEYICVQQ